jgi:membrane-bound hydrogenase subunit beta
MKTEDTTPKSLVDSLKKEFSAKLRDIRIDTQKSGTKKTEYSFVWMTVDAKDYKSLIKYLFTLDKYPHFAVSSGYDLGDTINIVNHFTLFHGVRGREVSLNITVPLPKSDPIIDTITDLIPGALIAEQEKQEMLGIKVKGIPKDQRVFVASDIPKGVYPWRKDETSAEPYARNLHEVKK